jgi:exonuclease SbcC
LYGDRNPEDEERKINEKVKEAERQLSVAENEYNQCNLEHNALKTAISGLKQSTEGRTGELTSGEAEFVKSLLREGFSGEEDFAGCRLSREALERLSREKNALDTLSGDIQSRRKEREKRLEEERAKNLSTATEEELQSALAKTTLELTTVYQRNGALRERKEANETALTRNLQLRREFDLQQAVYSRWFALNALIGSADGKKFRNFAQGITFELMVAHANRQLARLNDRYLLIRDGEEPLELNVVDNYQAGEIRTTKNLSGGESFIVSLALALGLSQMSGRKVRVDSLFLDEGFGTLDEEALDTALETLAGLRQEGKLIGVISHVAAFRDRINTRITVQPVRGGRSVISGPGVSKT